MSGASSGERPVVSSRPGRPASPPTPDRDLAVVVGMIATIAIPTIVALLSIRTPAPAAYSAGGNPSPLGYTLSLAFFVVPATLILWWFFKEPRYHIERRAFLLTLLWTSSMGIVLDLFLAHEFFTFPNPHATAGWNLPALDLRHGWTARIPAEEIAFYLLGFATILLVYIWANVYWMGAYCADRLHEHAAGVRRVLGLHIKSGLWALALLGAALAYKYAWPHVDRRGYPGYLTYLLVAAAGPSLVMFQSAKPIVNWRAFGFTSFLIVLVSVMWEATLAIPYGWWGYRPEAMLGLFIGAWHGLPVEAVLVWLASSWGTVIFYESMRLMLHMERPVAEALFGRRPARPTKG